MKEKRGPSPRERWIRQPEKDEALLALARPTAGRRRTEEPSGEQEESSPEEAELYRPSTSPVKYESSPERIMRKSAMQRPKTAAIRKVLFFFNLERHSGTVYTNTYFTL